MFHALLICQDICDAATAAAAAATFKIQPPRCLLQNIYKNVFKSTINLDTNYNIMKGNIIIDYYMN